MAGKSKILGRNRGSSSGRLKILPERSRTSGRFLSGGKKKTGGKSPQILGGKKKASRRSGQ